MGRETAVTYLDRKKTDHTRAALLSFPELQFRPRLAMADNLKPPADVFRSTSLARIADAIGLPMSYFYAVGDGEHINHYAKLDDAAVLALVRVYLQAIDPAARNRFADQVKVFVDELSP